MSDWLFIVGAVLVAVGLGAIHWYFAPIFLGSLLMLAAYVIASRLQVQSKPKPRHPDISAN